MLPNIATWWWIRRLRARFRSFRRVGDFWRLSGARPRNRRRPARATGRTAAKSVTPAQRRSSDAASTTSGGRSSSLSPRRHGGLAPARVRSPCVCGSDDARWLEGDARRLHASPTMSTRAHVDGRRVTSADVWVLEERPVDMTRCLPARRRRADRATARQPAESRGRQSLLVRSLSRTRRSDIAAGALLRARAVDIDTAGARQARANLQRLLLPRRIDGEEVGERTPAEIASIALYEMKPAFVRRGARERCAQCRIDHPRAPDAGNLADPQQSAAAPGRAGPAGGPEAELIDRAEGRCMRVRRALGPNSGKLQPGRRLGFLDIGRQVERGISTCALARISRNDGTVENLEVLLGPIDRRSLSLALPRRRRLGACARHGPARSPIIRARSPFQAGRASTSISSCCPRCDGMACWKRRSAFHGCSMMRSRSPRDSEFRWL